MLNVLVTYYRERLWPSPWAFISTALVIPASLLVFLPINMFVGIVTAIVLYTGCVVILLVTSPTIAVINDTFVAGRARLPLAIAGDVECFRSAEATLERGQRLDARAWLLIRGWVSPVIKVQVLDAEDPAPYWLVSTREPEKLAAAIETARNATATAAG